VGWQLTGPAGTWIKDMPGALIWGQMKDTRTWIAFLKRAGWALFGALLVVLSGKYFGVLVAAALAFLMATAIMIRQRGVKFTLFVYMANLMLLACAEVGVRYWIHHRATDLQRSMYLNPLLDGTGDKSHALYLPHHYMLYVARPYLSNTNGMRHNRLGLRDERDFGPKTNEIRIVFIGGSTVYDIGIKDNQKTYAPILERDLNKYYSFTKSGQRVEVINAGMAGSTSAENLMRLIFMVSELHPDIVVIQHGLNDVWPRMCGTIQSDFGNYRRVYGLPPLRNRGESWRSAISRRIVDSSAVLTVIAVGLGYRAQYEIAKMVTQEDVPKDIRNVRTNSAAYYERNTRFMVAISRSIGARVVLATEPWTQKASPVRKLLMPEHNAIVKRVAEEEGVDFFDFSEKMPHDTRYMKDGVHVNEEGGRLKAELYFKYFTESGLIEGIQKHRASAPHASAVPDAAAELLDEALKNEQGDKEDGSDL
jgi:lysophospholipase L1-like esterase